MTCNISCGELKETWDFHDLKEFTLSPYLSFELSIVELKMVSANNLTLQIEVEIIVVISTTFGKKTQKKKLSFNPWEALRPLKNISDNVLLKAIVSKST